MPPPINAGLHCLFLLVTACCQTSQDSNFGPFIQYIFDSPLGEETFQPEMQRQKRNMITFDYSPVEHIVDIEVSLMDSSFLEPVKDYLKNLNLTVSTNISNVEIKVSNISVTTVCLPSGENNSCCSCENGYAWPSKVCGDLITCPSDSLAPNLTCGYMRDMNPNRPYCEPQTADSCGMGDPIVTEMSVKLDTDFLEDLSNSSSDLYKKYKADLETALNASYRCLPGFVSATVTGFTPGSVFVNYQVKAGSASFKQIASANKILPQFLDPFYRLNQDTITTKITNETNFTVIPEDIFEGDTVRLICEINSTSENVTWYHRDQIISTSFPNSTDRGTSRSILEIANITMNNFGSYSCAFTKRNHQFLTLLYHDTKTITVSQLNITPNVNDTSVICNSPEMQNNGTLLSCCIDKHLPSLTVNWKVNGAINITGVSIFDGNCTEYKLNIKESLCPPEKSGTVTTYTCELQTEHGARSSQSISVRYLRAANVAISPRVNSSVSEGSSFNLTCKSDVSNYDNISWKIQSGNEIKKVDCDHGSCIINNESPETSLLKVKAATGAWNGTYICTVSQKYLNSSARVTIEVISLPLKKNILIDPIAASIQCKVQQTLQCCISDNTTKNYTVTFVVQQRPLQAVKKENGDSSCYVYNYTEEECGKDKKLTAYCRFMNHIGAEVQSENITLDVIPDTKISCKDSTGIGTEGDTLVKACHHSNSPNGFTRGNITYTCSNKSWNLQSNSCLSVPINRLLSDAESLVNSPDAKEELPEYLELLKNTTDMERNTMNHPANLGAIVHILSMVSSIPVKAVESTIKNFLSTVDIIVDGSTPKAWEDLNKGDGSSSLLNSIENFSLNLQPVSNNIPHVFAKTLQLQGIVVTEKSTDYNKNFRSTENLTVKVLIGETEVQTLTKPSTIVSVMYSKLGHILPGNNTHYVNGLLITTTVTSNISHKLVINMTFAKKNSSLKRPQCVFWNFTLNKGEGGWDTQGCTATWGEDDYVNCSCNHLTSFSILMSPDITTQVNFEDYITYVALAISILSLVTCIIIESLVWKYVTNNTTSYMRHVCIFNIAVSLLIADIWFIVTAFINDQNQQISTDICVVATFFIHLFYLCVFFWMLSLGLILFYRLVFILHNTSKTTQKAVAFCLGYGCPFVIAVITIAVTLPRNNYTRKGYCWLNWDDSKALLAFVIPALIIVVMNLFITAVVIIKILRPTIGDRSISQERKSLFHIGRSVAILTALLGLTWALGFVTIIKNSHQAFHILFVLFNALQGLFILVFGTLWDKKIQEALLKRNTMSKWSSQQTKSSSLILVTPMLAMSYPFSRTFNNLCGKTGKYRVSSSEPSSSSSENTSKSYSLLN